jgi:hypothetical protein
VKWVRARRGERCAYGCTVVRGEDVMLARRRFIVCRACAEQRYRERPPVVDLSKTRDGKAAALGTEE